MSKGRMRADRKLLFEKLEIRQMLSATSADFDGSLAVDGADLSAWQQNFGSTSAVHSQGDADTDGDVDGSDFLSWQRNAGTYVAVTSIEAEDATLTGAFAVYNDNVASGGQYTRVADGGFPDQTNGPNESQKATFTFSVDVVGTYQIKGGVHTNSAATAGSNDSFYVRVNGSADYFLWDVFRNTNYDTDYVSDRGGDDPVQVFLGEGPNTVEVYLREAGTRLDYLELELVGTGGNTAPTNMDLDFNTVPENSANGTVVGTVTTTDPDPGDAFSYLLLDDAGGRFAINANSGQITVANGSLLDFETTESHAVNVQVTDLGSNTLSQPFTIDVSDELEGGATSPTPGDRFNQFYDDVPLTPDFDYTATTISFDAASGEIRDSANGFGPLSTGDFIYVSGAAQDGNRSGWEITSKVNNGELKISATNNSNAVTNESAGNAVRVLLGQSVSDIQNQFFGNPNVQNAPFQRIIADPDNLGGKIQEQIAPKNEYTNAETGVHYFADLADINAQASEIYMGFWVRFMPGQSGGFLQSSLSPGDSSSFTLGNIFGDITDIPVDTFFGDGTTPRINAGELILGDPDGVHEVITFQGRTGSTILGSLVRGFRETTAQAWPVGTKVTIGYDWAQAHKLHGVGAGEKIGENDDPSTPGFTQTTVRFIQVYDSNTSPKRAGTPALYRFGEGFRAKVTELGTSSTPAGYSGGQKVFRQNKWEALEMRVRMNSAPGVADGGLSAWFNGEHVYEKNDIEWRGPNATISSTWDFFHHTTHWGGGTERWNTTKEERMRFDGFAIGLSPLNLFSAGRGAVSALASSSTGETDSTSPASEDFSSLAGMQSMQLSASSSESSADFDGSLLVDGADLSAWQQGFGSTSASHAQGDADADGDVDGSDFLAWQRNFGSYTAVTSLEAEDATLTGAFAAYNDAAASGGQYIRAVNVPDETNGPNEAQKATFTFNVATAGTYRIKGGVHTNSAATAGSNDSFYVRVNGSTDEWHCRTSF